MVEELIPLIKKVRKIVKLFRKSPVKNDILQSYVKASNPSSQSLTLILDVKTRWNSLLDMLRRFVRLRAEIEKALIDISMR